MPKPTSFLVALAAVAAVTACAHSGGDPAQPAALSSTSDSTPTATSVTAECSTIGESAGPRSRHRRRALHHRSHERPRAQGGSERNDHDRGWERARWLRWGRGPGDEGDTPRTCRRYR